MNAPPQIEAILADTESLGFKLASDEKTGLLLRTLAASKPGGRLLELGTGTGVSTAWLLDGMDASARLVSVDQDAKVQAVAQKHLGDDTRCTFLVQDGAQYLAQCADSRFDLIFADAWPGKLTHLDEAVRLLEHGGIYVVDDLLPQPTWPQGHASLISEFIQNIGRRTDLHLVKMDWSTGILVAVRR